MQTSVMGPPRFGHAHRVDVADGVRAANTLADPDYASAFQVSTIDDRSPEQWARRIFEDAPRLLRWFIVVGWKVALGLQLGPRASPDHVLGWKITTATPDGITLEVRSRLVTAAKVLQVESGRVTATTFVQYERWPGRIIWAVIAPVHHRTEPLLLTLAARRPDAA